MLAEEAVSPSPSPPRPGGGIYIQINLLPVADCDCKICSTQKGFCSACLCPVCWKFDCASKTCSWVGCDACSHWCHVVYGLKGSTGTTEMQFYRPGCDHASEMFDLSNMNLSGIVSDDIWRLRSLTVLNICCNELSSSLPKSLSGLRFLTSLDISPPPHCSCAVLTKAPPIGTISQQTGP